MRRGIVAAMLFATLLAAGAPADAQVRLKLLPQQRIQMQKPPKAIKLPPPPKINKAPQVPIFLIKPSDAIKIATRTMPNAKPVGIRQNGNNYIVTLRSNNTVTRVIVNAQTGAAN
jgi:hypothetical protein